MYVRMITGRDRGEVKEFSFPDGQDLIKRGMAVAVDVLEPGWEKTRLDLVATAPSEAEKPAGGLEPSPAVAEPVSVAPSVSKPPSEAVPPRKQPIFKRGR